MKRHKTHEEYLMNNIHKFTNTHAVFFNTLDRIYRKKEEEFLIHSEVLNDDYDQDPSVRYYFNSLGYRSDEFTKVHEGEHVLFAGCSETEGMGGDLESCWSYMTYKKLSETQKLSGFFNLSRGGWGHDVIIPNIIEYINTYGKPNKIYMLLPNLSRGFVWNGSLNQEELYYHTQKTPYFFLKDVTLLDGKTRPRQTLKEQRTSIVNFINLVKLFEEYCISNSIDLVWSTYSIPDGENYKNLNIFKNFIEMSDAHTIISKGENFFDEEIYSKKNLLYKRDGHLGYLHHYWWSQRFLGLIDTNDVS
jgi:hypothetical protein